jgi:hypothetical protein
MMRLLSAGRGFSHKKHKKARKEGVSLVSLFSRLVVFFVAIAASSDFIPAYQSR